MAELPFALVRVREGDIGFAAALDDDGFAGRVEDLATISLVLDTSANLELNGLEGAGGADWGRVCTFAGCEYRLRAELSSLVGEDDTKGGIDRWVGPGSGEGRGGGESGKEDS